MLHFLSDAVAFRADPLKFLTERGRSSPEGLEKLRMGFSPVYYLTNPELIKPVMKAPEAKIDKGRLVHKLRKLIGQNSLTMSGEPHKARRSVIHEHLARSLSGSLAPEIARVVRTHMTMMAEDETFDAYASMSPLSLRVICTLLFGENAMTRGDEAALINAVEIIEDDLASEMFKVMPDLPWVRSRKKRELDHCKEMMAFIVEKVRRNCSNNSLLAALEGLKLTDVELRDEILLLLLAGSHTSAAAATWTLYYLATEPEMRKRILEEAKTVYDENGDIISSRLKDATYTMGFVKEVLRLYPSGYWTTRETMTSTTVGDIHLKKGTTILMSPWHIHRDPRFWEAPETFNPERGHKGAAYFPFGAGPRVCVGINVGLVELQLICLEAARAFDLKVISEVPAPLPKPTAVTIVPPKIVIEISSSQTDSHSIAA